MSRRGEGRSQQTYSLPGKPVSLLASVCWWGGGGGGWQTCITAGLCGLGRGAWQTCITAGLFGWVGGGAVGWGGVAGKPVSLLASLGGWVGGAVGWGGVAGKPVSLLASLGGWVGGLWVGEGWLANLYHCWPLWVGRAGGCRLGGVGGRGGAGGAGKPVSLLASVGWEGRRLRVGGWGWGLANLYHGWPLGRSLSSTAFQSLALKKGLKIV